MDRKKLEEAVLEAVTRHGKSTGQLGRLDDLSDDALATVLDVDRAGFGMIADDGNLHLMKTGPDGKLVPPRPEPELVARLRKHRREICRWIEGGAKK